MSDMLGQVLPSSAQMADWTTARQAKRLKLKLSSLQGNALLTELMTAYTVSMMSGNVGSGHALMDFMLLLAYEMGQEHERSGVDIDTFTLPPEIQADLDRIAAQLVEIKRKGKALRDERNMDVA